MNHVLTILHAATIIFLSLGACGWLWRLLVGPLITRNQEFGLISVAVFLAAAAVYFFLILDRG